MTPPLTEKQKYFLLLGLVCEHWPHYAVDATLRAGYGQQYRNAASRLANVKLGKLPCLPDLLALLTHARPDFAVPAHLLPTP